MSDKIKHFYEFEKFRLDAENPSLWRDNKLVSISPKALETLILLVEKNGEIVSRDELFETVWKDTFVEEGNINYTISLLRKTLENKELIQTVSRHGYRFTGSINEISQNGKLPAEILTHQTKPSAEERSFRWILVSVLLVSLISLTSFAFWQRGDKTANPDNVSQTENPEAMQAYTRGKMILEDRDAKNRREKAIDEFQKAVTLDPTFALAYVGLAEVFASKAKGFSHQDGLENYAKARTAVQKAFALNPNLADAYSISGWIKLKADFDFEGAENDLRQAIQLDPENAITHFRLTHVLSPLGKHDESLAEIKRAYELDPISENIMVGHSPILESRGEFDEGLELSEKFLRDNKENAPMIRVYCTFLYHKENFAKVIELGEENLAKDLPNLTFAWLSLVAASYYKTDQFDKSQEILRQLETQSEKDTRALYSLAMNYAELGRADEAMLALQKCFEQREERMIWLKVEPRFANLRDDLRFHELLQKMNL